MGVFLTEFFKISMKTYFKEHMLANPFTERSVPLDITEAARFLHRKKRSLEHKGSKYICGSKRMSVEYLNIVSTSKECF